MRDGYLRGSLSRPATQRQMDVLAAFVAAATCLSRVARMVAATARHLAPGAACTATGARATSVMLTRRAPCR